jgi:hypothetical protein
MTELQQLIELRKTIDQRIRRLSPTKAKDTMPMEERQRFDRFASQLPLGTRIDRGQMHSDYGTGTYPVSKKKLTCMVHEWADKNGITVFQGKYESGNRWTMLLK